MQQRLEDRIKEYENAQKVFLLKKVPVIIRLDGKSFRNYSKGFDKPFDEDLHFLMINAGIQVAKEIQGFLVGYQQSDEITFLLSDLKTDLTDAWFNYNKSKLESITASLFTYYFNDYVNKDKTIKLKSDNKPAIFDSRAFNVPIHDVINTFLWRAKDFQRYSIQMLCRSLYSHKELKNKNISEMHELLFKKGINWSHLSNWKKNGTFIFQSESLIHLNSNIIPSYNEILNEFNKYNIIKEFLCYK